MSKKKSPAPAQDADRLGKSVAAARKRRGLTQAELAQRVGISQSHLSHYERGILRLHGRLLVKLAKQLEVTTDELLEITAADGNTFDVQRRFLRALKDVDKLSRRDQAALIKTIDAFIRGQLEKTA